MRQPYKDKFLSDVDGDGCPIPYRVPLALINIGKAEDHPLVQTLLADHRCLACPPPRGLLMTEEQANELLHGGPYPKWIDEARQLVREADLRMDVFTGQRDKGDALRALYGVERLSDSAAPDAFIGRKS